MSENLQPVSLFHVSTRKLQNLCGIVFILIYAIDFICQLLKYTGNIERPDTWHLTLMGGLSLLGFVMLYMLASNTIAEIFSFYQIAAEAFFTFALRYLVKFSESNPESYIVIAIICILINIGSVYLYSLVLEQCKFKNLKRGVLTLIPVMFIINIYRFLAQISAYGGVESIYTYDVFASNWFIPVKCTLCVIMAVCYWLLSHSECFSQELEYNTKASMSPLNPYTLCYGVAIVIGMFLF